MISSHDEIKSLGRFSPDKPIKILVSACLLGDKCGVDGNAYGHFLHVENIVKRPNVSHVKFCPEHFSFGTPRNTPDIVGGNGFDVLNGTARVMSNEGEDWTEGMLRAAEAMLTFATKEKVDVVILTDFSAACGPQVIFDGIRNKKDLKYQKGPGVCAALLIKNGFKVIGHKDFKTLDLLNKQLDTHHEMDPSHIDQHETEEYLNYFGNN